MPPDNKPTRRLAAILFADIVGYTAMMQSDEGQTMSRLRHYQEVLQSEVDHYHGQIIKNYGDGSLCVFNSVLDAVNCAKAVQETLGKEPKVPLRIGLHLGDIMYEGNDIYGNALNVASRIESMGISGAVLLSKDIYKKVKNQADLKFESLGTHAFKNVDEPMEIYALSTEGMAVPKADEMKGKFKKTSNSPWSKIIMVIAALAIISLAYPYFKKDASTQNATIANAEIERSSIAVLPFDNMSVDPDNEFFTNGMHDGLLTHLSKISGMKVISRTSVKQYKDTEKSIPLIAQELSVANILEGSVQRSGDQVRVNVQLIDGVTDEHLWSKIYDKKVTAENIFDLQTEIVTAIAAELETTISPAQRSILDERPTESLEAYEAYLRARQLMEIRSNESLYSAKELLEKVIRIDPKFALAHIHLASVYNLLIEYAGADRAVNLKQANHFLEKGLALNPNLGEGYALQGNLQMDKGYYTEAQQSYDKAAALNPNYDRTYHWNSLLAKGYEKDIDKACTLIRKAVALSPLDPSILVNVAMCEMEQGNFEEGKRIVKKSIDLVEAYPDNWGTLADIYFHTNQLDSAVIWSLVAVEINGKTGRYIADYIYTLDQLNLDDIMKSEFDSFEPLNDQDKGTQSWIEKGMKLETENFQNSIEILNPNLEDDNSNNGGLAWGLYNGRDWANLVKYYQKGFDKMQDSKELLNSRFLHKLEIFHKYIYALHQVEESEKANALWNKLGKPILAKYGDLNSVTMQKQLQVIRLRTFAIEQDQEGLLSLLEEIYDEHWAWLVDIDDDPMMDIVRDHLSYISIIENVDAKLKVQQDNVRAYLKVKG